MLIRLINLSSDIYHSRELWPKLAPPKLLSATGLAVKLVFTTNFCNTAQTAIDRELVEAAMAEEGKEEDRSV